MSNNISLFRSWFVQCIGRDLNNIEIMISQKSIIHNKIMSDLNLNKFDMANKNTLELCSCNEDDIIEYHKIHYDIIRCSTEIFYKIYEYIEELQNHCSTMECANFMITVYKKIHQLRNDVLDKYDNCILTYYKTEEQIHIIKTFMDIMQKTENVLIPLLKNKNFNLKETEDFYTISKSPNHKIFVYID
jgi:hypothetical protein